MRGKGRIYQLEWSAIFVILGISILFIMAIGVTLALPSYVDESWVSPSCLYQKQMYEISDYYVYFSTKLSDEEPDNYAVHHLKKNFSLLAFQETDTIKIVAPPSLKKYITGHNEKPLKLTSDLLLLRAPETHEDFDARAAADKLIETLSNSESDDDLLDDFDDLDLFAPEYTIYELYKLNGDEAFSVRDARVVPEDWVEHDFVILDESPRQEFHREKGVIFVNNPVRYTRVNDGKEKTINSLRELKELDLNFHSRHELIRKGEQIYAREGCWYCHSDQTRTLIQDVILTGTNKHPAPPSSANEYIYEEISFTGTRRIGPDISRIGAKRPVREWHKVHFWQTDFITLGSIMPFFHHFFEPDPFDNRRMGHANYLFEAVYQYLMTKGTRITAPTEAWWEGKDPVQTKEIIEGKKKLP